MPEINKLAIMNGCSVIGRLIPGFFVRSVGVFNMLVFCTIVCSGVVFAISGLQNIAGVVGIGVPMGLFSGACAFVLSYVLFQFIPILMSHNYYHAL